jgi:DNA-binding XRE family transcriptional regulator
MTATIRKSSWGGTRNVVDDAVVLAIAVLQERIGRLAQEDKDDLYQLMPALFSDDAEERESARLAVQEIVTSETSRMARLEIPAEPGHELKNWIAFVSQQIRAERRKADLTQEELAKRAGIPQSHVSRLENGQHSPTSMTLEKIAHALGVPVSRFDPGSDDARE